MYTDTMRLYLTLKLTRSEAKLLQALSAEKPQSAYGLEKKARLPHSTTLYALKSLHSRGLAKNHAYKRRLLWTKGVAEPAEFLGDDSVFVHQGKRALQTLVNDIFTLAPYERLYTLQGEKTFTTWAKMLGERYIAKLNRRIKSHKIIVETVIPSDLFYAEKLPRSFLKSYRGRMTDARIVPRDLFAFSSDLAIWKNRVCLMNWRKKIAIEIRDTELSKLVLSLFFFTQANARKIDINSTLTDV